MTKKIAVILAGCGYLDGAEIRESVLALLYLDKAKAEVEIFAEEKHQYHVVNHATGEEQADLRNVFVESSRIARGKIKSLDKLDAKAFDGLILPGGFGVAKNYSDIAFKGADGSVDEKYLNAIQSFNKQDKPIGAICIAPAAVAIALKGKAPLELTLGGSENKDMIEGVGSKHVPLKTNEICIDDKNNIVSTSAYMRDNAKLSDVSDGIEKLVNEVLKRA